MNIALVGYGKMGKAIERIAQQRGHQVVLRISSTNREELNAANLAKADAAIEFTNPEAAYANIMACIEAGVPVVCGSTGWNEQLELAREACLAHNGAFLQTSNFSVGVNLFFRINAIMAELMNQYTDYDISIEETHHTHKKDAPSGTAITIAEVLLGRLKRKERWVSEKGSGASDMVIRAHRVDEVPGTHLVKYSSAIDDIELIHTAHNRDGFALGAVLAAEYIHTRKGIFTMNDVLGL